MVRIMMIGFAAWSDIYGVGLIKSRRCIEISAARFAPARHVYCPASEHGGGRGGQTTAIQGLLLAEHLCLLSLI